MLEEIIIIINTIMLCYVVSMCYTQSIMDFCEKKYNSFAKFFLYGTSIIGFYCWYDLLLDNIPPTLLNTIILTCVFSVMYYCFVCVVIGVFYMLSFISQKLKSMKR